MNITYVLFTIVGFAAGVLVSTIVVISRSSDAPIMLKPVAAQCYTFNGTTWDRLTNHGKSN